MIFLRRLQKRRSFNKSFHSIKLTIILLLFCVFYTSADGSGRLPTTNGSFSLNDIKAVVKGKVTSENGMALPGVSVQIKGTGKGVVTDADGHYTISASDNDVLVFSYIGYTSQEVTPNSRTEINITLLSSNAELAQVVVIGYGTQRKRDLTGS